MPGYAGNFLARLFSLGKEVVPLLTLSILNQRVKNIHQDESFDRLRLYSFDNAKLHDSWQEYHRIWADYYARTNYQLLSAIWRKKFLVYCIHPHEFSIFEDEITSDPKASMFYVELDDRHNSWVEESKEKLKFINRPHEPVQHEVLRQKYNMPSINLSKMLDSSEQFLEEYIRCCNLIGLETHLEQAMLLYENWISIRK
jgi:hypothetical protein